MSNFTENFLECGSFMLDFTLYTLLPVVLWVVIAILGYFIVFLIFYFIKCLLEHEKR